MLHKTKGDEMLVEITQGIKALNEKQLKDVLGIIGSYSNDLLINFCSKSLYVNWWHYSFTSNSSIITFGSSL